MRSPARLHSLLHRLQHHGRLAFVLFALALSALPLHGAMHALDDELHPVTQCELCQGGQLQLDAAAGTPLALVPATETAAPPFIVIPSFLAAAPAVFQARAPPLPAQR